MMKNCGYRLKRSISYMSHVMRKSVYAIWEQQRHSSAGASTQSDQHLCCLDSIIPILAESEISILYLVSVAEQAGLSLTWTQTQKTGFVVMRLISYLRKMWSGPERVTDRDFISKSEVGIFQKGNIDITGWDSILLFKARYYTIGV